LSAGPELNFNLPSAEKEFNSPHGNITYGQQIQYLQSVAQNHQEIPPLRQMSQILTFKKARASEKHKGKGLCREGFHKWAIEKESVFDVKQGKLVTVKRCKRCGKTRITAK
jgi:hypothetical protein